MAEYIFVRDRKTAKDKRPRFLICKRGKDGAYEVNCLVHSEEWAKLVVQQLNLKGKHRERKYRLS